MAFPSGVLAQGTLDVRALREDYRRIQSQLEDLLVAHNALKKEMGQLRSELRKGEDQISGERSEHSNP